MSMATLTAESLQRWSLRGEVGTGNVAPLRAQGDALLKQAGAHVVVDLGGITRSTSVCISLLLCWMREAECLGKRIAFANMPAKMLDVARVSSLEGILPFADAG